MSISKREIFLIALAFLALIIFVPVFTYMYFANDLKTKDAVMNKNDTGLILLDRNNKPFFTFYQAKFKNFVPLQSIPKYIPESVIASEDKDFYKHTGFSFPAIIRAFFIDIVHRDKLYGGSTLTQQLVKNALLSSNKSYFRKVQEIVLAQEIERRYTKDEILEMYLNSVYFGQGAFGIDNASVAYFGKHAKDLSVAESAFLTAILPSPSAYSPYSDNVIKAKKIQQEVLQKMYEQKYISPAEYAKAKSTKLTFNPTPIDINATAPHFALMVRDQLIQKYGEEQIARSGFRVKTTLDLPLQKYAEQAVKNQVTKLHPDNVSNGAAVVMDPKTGEVKALVGSADWYNAEFGKMNMATTTRSVGSSFKPIIYASAMESHIITPATILQDVPTTFPGGYRPLDYDRKFRGPVTVRRALTNSLNIPAVEVMQKVGVAQGLAMAKRMGITTLSDNPADYGLTLVLGTGEIPLLELTDVYSVFATGGVRPDPYIIQSVKDKNGATLFTAHPKTETVLSPQVSFLISSILSDNKTRAEEFGNLLNISRPAAVKTGTAEDFKDALTMGYTPSVVVGVWVGNNNNEAMDTVAGSLGAAPIWKSLMEYELQGTPVEAFTPPPGVVKVSVCSGGVQTNSASHSAYMTSSEYFISGTQPAHGCAPRIEPIYPTISGVPPVTVNPQLDQSNRVLQEKIREQVKEQIRKMNEDFHNHEHQNEASPSE